MMKKGEQEKMKQQQGASVDVPVHGGGTSGTVQTLHRGMITPSQANYVPTTQNANHVHNGDSLRHDDGAWRSQQGGYCGPPPEMRSMTPWDGRGPPPEKRSTPQWSSHDPTPEMRSTTQWEGQYSSVGVGHRPTSYHGGIDYRTWVPNYNRPIGQYDGPGETRHHAESNAAYYNRSGLPFPGRNGKYDAWEDPYGSMQIDNHQYNSRHWPAPHAYMPPYRPEESEQLGRSSIHPSSPPPSSTVAEDSKQAEVLSCMQVQEEVKHPEVQSDMQVQKEVKDPKVQSDMQVQEDVKQPKEQVHDGGPQLKRPLHLAADGYPTGKMATLFHTDIVAFVKEMNPTEGWDGQTADAKQHIVAQLMELYEIQGENNVLSAKYMRKTVGAALIQWRHYLNQLIDKNNDRPHDVNEVFWEAMKDKRDTKESKEKSEKMSNIAKVRATKQNSKRALEQAAILRLTMELEREPDNAEIAEAVRKDLSKLKDEVGNKRRLKVANTSNTVILQDREELQKRIDVLESFMFKWSSRLEEWSTILNEGDDHSAEDAKNAKREVNTNKGTFCLTNHPLEDEAEEEDVGDTSDDSEDSDSSKDSVDFEIESKDVQGRALHDETMLESLPTAPVVAPRNGGLSTDELLHHASIASIVVNPIVPKGPPTVSPDFGNWSEVLAAGTAPKLKKTKKQVTAVRSSARTAQKAVKAAASVQGTALQNRPAKRVKLNANSEKNPLEIDDDSIEDEGKELQAPAQNAKVPRTRTTNCQRKKEVTTSKKDK